MKLKKGILLTIFTLTTIALIGCFNSVQAETATTPKTLNIKELRSEKDSEGNGGNGHRLENALTSAYKQIWKIYDASSPKDTFYCIKGGPGFGTSSGDMGTSSIVPTTYSQKFDLRYPKRINTPYSSALIDYTSKDYERFMWVLDQCYVAPTKASEEDAAEQSKRILLDAVENYVKKYPGVYGDTVLNNQILYDKLTDALTNDDIEAIQQLAIWYYTNDDEYHVASSSALNISINKVRGEEGNYDTLNIDRDEDAIRIYAMKALFDYLTLTPQEDEFSYAYNDPDNSRPVEIANTTVEFKTSGDRLIVGPYRIEQIREVSYSLDIDVYDENGARIRDAIILDTDKNEITTDDMKTLVDQNFYISIPANTSATKIELYVFGSLNSTSGTKITYWSVEGAGNANQPVIQLEKTNKTYTDSRIDRIPSDEPEFDLALRKFITEIKSADGTVNRTVGDRAPKISDTELSKLANGNVDTALKTHTKEPLVVKTGDIVTYKIRIYNEGEIDGWATKVTDYLPEGLALVSKDKSAINTKYDWQENTVIDINTGKSTTSVTTTYLAATDKKLSAYENGGTTSEGGENGTVKKYKGLSYVDLEIQCKVVATESNKDLSLKNIAEITTHKDINNNTVDRDSQPGNVTKNPNNYNPKNPTNGIGEQDDDDYEELKLLGKYFDLSLRKFITDVTTNGVSKPLLSREPNVVVSPLLNGKDTATYNHTKEPVGVSNGDIVTYTIRVYNEGQIDGYVTEIVDHLPPQLEFIVNDQLNTKYGWQFVEGSNGRKVKTVITSNATNDDYSATRELTYKDRKNGTLLKAFDGKKLDYIDVQIRCRVKDNIKLSEKITNIAEITKMADFEGNEIKTDRDSTVNNRVIPTDESLPTHKDQEIESGKAYIKGDQDDDDFEKLVVQRFDLALRKFITKVNDTDITSRAPVFKVVGDKYTYEHTKEPVEVANGNTVIYTLRIFNEGNVSGYATKVKDDIPDGLEFLPEDSTNTAFGWKMYKEDGTETKNVEEAKYIETDFLSKDKEKQAGDNLIKAFDTETMTMPDYKDLKIAFKVTEPNTSDRIVINTAEITEDSDENGKPIDDVDSTPNNDKDGEDDIDIEKIKVKFFDLSLRKWVTESIVTFNGKTTVTKSHHTAEDEPEVPMKVEIRRRNINKTTVKFKFNIRVKNEGEIAGYAKEIVDYIPEGLKFVAKDNPKWKEVDGKVTTDQLKDTLLQPGESATVEITLTWINSEKNMARIDNWAEINKDENEYNSPDIDSTPGNNVKGEDDIDYAPVLLAPSTGKSNTYITLVIASISMLAGGIFLIKKFVI